MYYLTVDLRFAVPLALALLLSLVLYELRCRAARVRTLRHLADAAARIGTEDSWTRLSREGDTGDLAAVLNEIAFRVDRDLERTRTEKNRLNAILRGMGEGILVADADGTVTLVNPAFRTLFALTAEVEGRPLIDISRHPGLHDTFRQVTGTGTERVEELLLTSGGERIVLTHWVPLTETGTLQGVVVVFHDITEIRRLENIRKDFVANVSHELRTPITIIKGYAETLASGGLENQGQATRFVSIIATHAERLATLVDDLLTLSRLESGNVSLEVKSVPVEVVAGRVASLLEQKSQAKQILVDVSGLAGTPLVLADPGRLEQILVNLLDNAIKYTPSGGAVTFSAACEGNLVRIGVHDTGMGIATRDLPRVFERFYRADKGRSRDEGGTGLGLSIVKHLVQMQGGSVSVESSGRGTSFFFTLKRALTLSGEKRPLHEDLSILQQSRDVGIG
ncbi:ATP-binding protein [Geomesophilobacter sediminis]|uniref:histidine kinase n=1 Tax=Geomesophilobacter sediminis TaxID=2798584 RepID=A0A8J7JEH3_9BACT|nr:ATP-binding protein [Geomesophilobacter sediminis]MBJ6724464.1 PAS domain-containing protein [Geomesophilobacter sediminis]